MTVTKVRNDQLFSGDVEHDGAVTHNGAVVFEGAVTGDAIFDGSVGPVINAAIVATGSLAPPVKRDIQRSIITLTAFELDIQDTPDTLSVKLFDMPAESALLVGASLDGIFTKSTGLVTGDTPIIAVGTAATVTTTWTAPMSDIIDEVTLAAGLTPAVDVDLSDDGAPALEYMPASSSIYMSAQLAGLTSPGLLLFTGTLSVDYILNG